MIHHADCRTVDLRFVAEWDVLLTDPPYRAHVHSAATSQSKGRGTRKRDLGFESLSRSLRQKTADFCATVKRWAVVYSDVEDSTWLRLAVQARGCEYIRTVPWVRWSMPQLSGDRPPQGFEHVLWFHRPGKKSWNGPGNLTALNHLALRGEGKHKCEKPLDQALDLVSWTSNPGETIFDPFSGSGVFGVASRLLGRNFVGCETDTELVEKGNVRLKEHLSPRDCERAKRWLEAPTEPVSALDVGPSTVRARNRDADRERVRKVLGL